MTGRTDRTNVGTVEDLHASAVKACGLDDFGGDDDNYREALGVLLESFRRDADLTELGSKMHRFFVRNALVARLVSEAAFKQHPQHAEVSVERPIFVTGLPRTGTTAIHRLLTADPAHQGLELWLAEFPRPRPPRETWSQNPFFQQLDAQFNKAHEENPDYTGLHYMTADEVEECWQLLRQSLHSVSYETLAHLPTYARWLAEQDWTKSYQRHRKNLQLIGLNDREKRWVLKNPSHLFALDALFTVYPDALVVQCHRPAETIMASMCSLAQHTTEGWSNSFSGDVIGQDSLETWSRGLGLFNTERAKRDPAQFCDVDYFEFIKDPIAAVEEIYRQFGIDFTDAARASMTDLHAASQKGPRAPKHTYSLADYGLTDEQVRDRFSGLEHRSR
ncbi:sulfotransferase [Mycolicibacterium cyprinidarum]|nr:sulfotransferase [Mycolicibacterium sp. NGTWS1803]